MIYSISFKDLPFEPEERQVIYIENKYDERINAIIKGNYEQIKWAFKRANLDFVYLPMFFNDEETREKILYYAPYLTSDIIEKTELRSSYLLGYMSHQENRERISPSVLYAPKRENKEWKFEGQTIDINNCDNIKIRQWFEAVVSKIEEELTPVISFSLAEEDIQKPEEPSTIESQQVEYSSTPDLRKHNLETEPCKEEIVREDDEGKANEEENERKAHIWEKIRRWIKSPSKEIEKEEDSGSTPNLDEIREEDVTETIEDLERNIKRLRLLGIPLTVIVEFVAKYETISRLRLTDDYRIFLPDYGNLEVKMSPLCKAIFFLFLNHPEGIILKRLEEHHHELVNYYLQTSNRDVLTPKMLERINNLGYPGNENINVVLSRTNKYFRKVIDEHLAKHYYILGKPGEPYKIALDRLLFEWEDEDE